MPNTCLGRNQIQSQHSMILAAMTLNSGQIHCFLSHCVPWQWGRLFLSLKRLQAAAGAWPFNCLSHFMGCMPWLRFWKFGRSTIWRLCAWWFLKSNLNGIIKTHVARQSCEWLNWNHTSDLWDSSRSWQWLYQTSHHKKVSLRDHSGFNRLQYKEKTAKRLLLFQRDNFSNQHIQDMVWAWDIKLLQLQLVCSLAPI